MCVDDKGGTVAEGTLNFDVIVDGHETQLIEVDESFAESCTITEDDSNGADLVEYECEFCPADVAPEAPAPEGDQGSCIDGQSAGHFHNRDFGSFLVRNIFDADVLPDDEDPPPVVNPDVVAATPSFTG